MGTQAWPFRRRTQLHLSVSARPAGPAEFQSYVDPVSERAVGGEETLSACCKSWQNLRTRTGGKAGKESNGLGSEPAGERGGRPRKQPGLREGTGPSGSVFSLGGPFLGSPRGRGQGRSRFCFSTRRAHSHRFPGETDGSADGSARPAHWGRGEDGAGSLLRTPEAAPRWQGTGGTAERPQIRKSVLSCPAAPTLLGHRVSQAKSGLTVL